MCMHAYTPQQINQSEVMIEYLLTHRGELETLSKYKSVRMMMMTKLHPTITVSREIHTKLGYMATYRHAQATQQNSTTHELLFT